MHNSHIFFQRSRGPHVKVNGLPLRNVSLQWSAEVMHQRQSVRQTVKQPVEPRSAVPLVEGRAQDV